MNKSIYWLPSVGLGKVISSQCNSIHEFSKHPPAWGQARSSPACGFQRVSRMRFSYPGWGFPSQDKVFLPKMRVFLSWSRLRHQHVCHSIPVPRAQLLPAVGGEFWSCASGQGYSTPSAVWGFALPPFFYSFPNFQKLVPSEWSLWVMEKFIYYKSSRGS